TAFSASQILGIPAGLFLSNLWGWHAPFIMIVAVSVPVGAVIVLRLRPIDAHLKPSGQRQSPFGHLRATVANPSYLEAFATTVLLSTGVFMLMPFGSAFSVHNLGVDLEKLPLVYLITGLFALCTGPLVGRAADRFGKFRPLWLAASSGAVWVPFYPASGGRR